MPAESREIVDISDIAENNHGYAIHVATKSSVLAYENGLFQFAGEVTTPFEVVDVWRELSLGCEIMLKALLLRYEIPFLKKRAHAQYGPKVHAFYNPWLQNLLRTLQITYIAQINTGTISTALQSAQELLFDKIALDHRRRKLIPEMFMLIIRTRRNRNTHFFFPNQAVLDISEVEMLFIPLLNMLEEIYQAAETKDQYLSEKL